MAANTGVQAFADSTFTDGALGSDSCTLSDQSFELILL